MVLHSKELESAVLGAALIEGTAFGRTMGLIDARCFYVDDNAKVYTALREMYENSAPIDLLTVSEHMAANKATLHAGNVGWYLVMLSNSVAQTTHLEYHCHLLKKMWRKRELEKLTKAGIDPFGDDRRQAIEIQKQIQDILSGSEVKQDWHSMDAIIFNLLVHQSKVQSGEKTFVTTGFRGIDRINGGFSEGQMIVIGARPGVGKSALINKMAFAVAAQKKTVGIISLEMDNIQIAARLAAIDTDTDFQTVYRGLFYDEQEHEKFYNHVSRHTINYPIYVSDKTKVDVTEIKTKAIKLKHQHGLDLLIIDYLQLVEGDEKKNAVREQEVAKISRGLKLLAMELGIPVVVLCQLNRASLARKGNQRYPQLQDLRESGSIEQDADIVMMLHRDWAIDLHTDEQGNSTEFDGDLLGVKWRNGQGFHLKLHFEPRIMKFSEPEGDSKPRHVPKVDYTGDQPYQKVVDNDENLF